MDCPTGLGGFHAALYPEDEISCGRWSQHVAASRGEGLRGPLKLLLLLSGCGLGPSGLRESAKASSLSSLIFKEM